MAQSPSQSFKDKNGGAHPKEDSGGMGVGTKKPPESDRSEKQSSGIAAYGMH